LRCLLARCFVLLTLASSCGGGNDNAKQDASDPCFTVTPDSAALAAGAMPGKQTQCVGDTNVAQQTLSNGSSESTTDVIIFGVGNQRPSPDWATVVARDSPCRVTWTSRMIERSQGRL
jgi:hypothetical protein